MAYAFVVYTCEYKYRRIDAAALCKKNIPANGGSSRIRYRGPVEADIGIDLLVSHLKPGSLH